jgi:hypothetical protein
LASCRENRLVLVMLHFRITWSEMFHSKSSLLWK